MNHTIHAQYELNTDKLRQVLTDVPGVYLFRDASGRIIYVGKAKSLKKRVMSYFRSSSDLNPKTAMIMKRAKGIDFFFTSSEKEALILEDNLIKKHIPRYNIVLRDDKQYPFLRLNIKEPYPYLGIVRRIKKDGALYFGPFSSVYAVRDTKKVIDRVFQLRKCKSKTLVRRSRPCLNYQMGRCLGPCTYDVPMSIYQESVTHVKLFLEGRNKELIDHLKADMSTAADRLAFERAARIRDQIKAIEKTIERQHVVSTQMTEQDIIGLANLEEQFQVVILFVRAGRLIGSRDYLFKDPAGSASEVMEAFIKQYYPREAFIPKEILISEPIQDQLPIVQWLCDLARKNVILQAPSRGKKRSLVGIAMTNAANLLNGRAASKEAELMNMVKDCLKLKHVPRVIEGLDISNLQGDMAVGAVVSFVSGLPHKPGYRNYKIKAVNGIDDYGMISELVERRTSKGQQPDLFLVDGGKGHLTAVFRTLQRQMGQNAPEVVSIAKADESRRERFDRIFIPGQKNPLNLRPDHPVLLLMMRIRDEAHRRALSYHRRLRKKNLNNSELDLVPGIGAHRKYILLNYFKDINEISKASFEDLTAISGISRSLAKGILTYFEEKNKEKNTDNFSET